MKVSSSLDRPIKVSDVPLEKMANNSQISEKDKIAEVSRQFEAILVRQILAESQKSQMNSKAPSGTSEIYKDMVTTQLAESISRSGAVGLSSVLEKQLGRQVLPHSGAENNNSKGVSVKSKL